ncbi:MAG: CHASE3 domain-containing protein [Acidobacteria bacterium]|nr:CHASE3 domain-containing protein [Acidobacteriota bacterium]
MYSYGVKLDAEKLLVAGFAAALLLLLALGFITYRVTGGLVEDSGWVAHTYQVIGLLEDAETAATNTETAQRGYVIAGDERFLAPYRDALPRLERDLSEVERLTTDNPSQQRRAAELRARVADKLALVGEVIALRRDGRTEEAARVVRSGRGEEAMNAVRQMIAEMIGEETRLLALRTEASKSSAVRVGLTFFLLTAFVFALLVLSYLLFRRDVARRKARARALRDLSLTDELTGLYNRRGFLTLSEQQVRLSRRRGEQLLLLFADMDGLKRINDEHGHDAGSRAIAAAGEVLRRTFRDSDVLARLGGDEFVALVTDTAGKGPEFFTERLREGLRRHNEQAAAPYAVSLSVGAARLDGTLNVEEAVARADELMYQNKRRKGAGRQYAEKLL